MTAEGRSYSTPPILQELVCKSENPVFETSAGFATGRDALKEENSRCDPLQALTRVPSHKSSVEFDLSSSTSSLPSSVPPSPHNHAPTSPLSSSRLSLPLLPPNQQTAAANKQWLASKTMKSLERVFERDNVPPTRRISNRSVDLSVEHQEQCYSRCYPRSTMPKLPLLRTTGNLEEASDAFRFTTEEAEHADTSGFDVSSSRSVSSTHFADQSCQISDLDFRRTNTEGNGCTSSVLVSITSPDTSQSNSGCFFQDDCDAMLQSEEEAQNNALGADFSSRPIVRIPVPFLKKGQNVPVPLSVGLQLHNFLYGPNSGTKTTSDRHLPSPYQCDAQATDDGNASSITESEKETGFEGKSAYDYNSDHQRRGTTPTSNDDPRGHQLLSLSESSDLRQCSELSFAKSTSSIGETESEVFDIDDERECSAEQKDLSSEEEAAEPRKPLVPQRPLGNFAKPTVSSALKGFGSLEMPLFSNQSTNGLLSRYRSMSPRKMSRTETLLQRRAAAIAQRALRERHVPASRSSIRRFDVPKIHATASFLPGIPMPSVKNNTQCSAQDVLGRYLQDLSTSVQLQQQLALAKGRKKGQVLAEQEVSNLRHPERKKDLKCVNYTLPESQHPKLRLLEELVHLAEKRCQAGIRNTPPESRQKPQQLRYRQNKAARATQTRGRAANIRSQSSSVLLETYRQKSPVCNSTVRWASSRRPSSSCRKSPCRVTSKSRGVQTESVKSDYKNTSTNCSKPNGTPLCCNHNSINSEQRGRPVTASKMKRREKTCSVLKKPPPEAARPKQNIENANRCTSCKNDQSRLASNNAQDASFSFLRPTCASNGRFREALLDRSGPLQNCAQGASWATHQKPSPECFWIAQLRSDGRTKKANGSGGVGAAAPVTKTPSDNEGRTSETEEPAAIPPTTPALPVDAKTTNVCSSIQITNDTKTKSTERQQHAAHNSPSHFSTAKNGPSSPAYAYTTVLAPAQRLAYLPLPSKTTVSQCYHQESHEGANATFRKKPVSCPNASFYYNPSSDQNVATTQLHETLSSSVTVGQEKQQVNSVVSNGKGAAPEGVQKNVHYSTGTHTLLASTGERVTTSNQQVERKDVTNERGAVWEKQMSEILDQKTVAPFDAALPAAVGLKPHALESFVPAASTASTGVYSPSSPSFSSDIRRGDISQGHIYDLTLQQGVRYPVQQQKDFAASPSTFPFSDILRSQTMNLKNANMTHATGTLRQVTPLTVSGAQTQKQSPQHHTLSPANTTLPFSYKYPLESLTPSVATKVVTANGTCPSIANPLAPTAPSFSYLPSVTITPATTVPSSSCSSTNEFIHRAIAAPSMSTHQVLKFPSLTSERNAPVRSSFNNRGDKIQQSPVQTNLPLSQKAQHLPQRLPWVHAPHSQPIQQRSAGPLKKVSSAFDLLLESPVHSENAAERNNRLCAGGSLCTSTSRIQHTVPNSSSSLVRPPLAYSSTSKIESLTPSLSFVTPPNDYFSSLHRAQQKYDPCYQYPIWPSTTSPASGCWANPLAPSTRGIPSVASTATHYSFPIYAEATTPLPLTLSQKSPYHQTSSVTWQQPLTPPAFFTPS